MTDEELAELRYERERATVPVVCMAGLVACYALFRASDPLVIGEVAVIWGLYLLLQFRYSWTLLISALVMILGGWVLLTGGGQ